MIADSRTRLREFCAWPSAPLVDDRGRLLGFTMRRVVGVEWFSLTGIGSRLQVRPAADYRFLVGCSANLARAIASLHAEGIVVGDVNESLPLVAENGKVTLIDCDSFQFEANGQLFTCNVAKPEYLPPELQGSQGVRGIRREKRHDLFGLAVLVFEMLMLGRHPFSGVPVSGELPEIQESIRRKMYAYARPSGIRGLLPPPGTLPIEALGAECVALFDAAFGSGERPAAASWAAALDRLMQSLRRCSVNPAHWFDLKSCPLCAIEAQSGREIFVHRSRVREVFEFIGAPEIDALWRAIEAVRPPPQADALRASWTGPLQNSGQTWRGIARWVPAGGVLLAAVVLCAQTGVAVFIIVGLIGAVLAANVGGTKRAAANRRFKEMVQRRDELVAQWKRAASRELFAQVRSRLMSARDELRSIPEAYRIARREAENSRRNDQMQEYLAKHRIERASIRGIRRGRAATLRSFGIETAADVTTSAVLAVPGFGPALTQSLVAYRASVERGFVFDPKQPVSASKIGKIDQEFRSRQARLIAALKSGLAELTATARQCAVDCERLAAEIDRAVFAAREA